MLFRFELVLLSIKIDQVESINYKLQTRIIHFYACRTIIELFLECFMQFKMISELKKMWREHDGQKNKEVYNLFVRISCFSNLEWDIFVLRLVLFLLPLDWNYDCWLYDWLTRVFFLFFFVIFMIKYAEDKNKLLATNSYFILCKKTTTKSSEWVR